MVFKKIPNHSKLISIVSFAQLEQFLKSQPEIKSAEKIAGKDFFNETWKIMVRQPLDHADTTRGFFLQRVFVADKGKENAVLLITEGYGGQKVCRLLLGIRVSKHHNAFPEWG